MPKERDSRGENVRGECEHEEGERKKGQDLGSMCYGIEVSC